MLGTERIERVNRIGKFDGTVWHGFEKVKIPLNLQEEIFQKILNAEDGDYVAQAIILTVMKPEGW